MDELDFYQRLISSGLSSDQATANAARFLQATESLRDRTRSGDCHYWFVPGRIEFLGKHTDYAGGRSLICAVERGFCVAAAARNDSVVRITDWARQESVDLMISTDLRASDHWSNYAATVLSRVAQNFPGSLQGADIVFISDLPSASGLSSSSALIIAIFEAIAWVNRLKERIEYKSNISNPEDLAGFLGTIENGQTFGSLQGRQGVGTFGGSQDHTAILCCRAGMLSQYSFCPVRQEATIALPDDHIFVVGVSGVSADKTGNALAKYNRVSLLAREVLSIWNDVEDRTDETLMAAVTSPAYDGDRVRKAIKSAHSSFPADELLNRLQQFIEECFEIIPDVARKLKEGRLDQVGELVDRSQAGAERRLCNQVPETIALARGARELGAAAASAFG